tara:strand:+ start:174 stop:1937 length:1764 start_codon:yes stop_codon:yes gene_type:complete
MLRCTLIKLACTFYLFLSIPFSFGQGGLPETPQVVLEPILKDESLPINDQQLLNIPDIGPNRTLDNSETKILVKSFSLIFEDKNLIIDQIKISSQDFVDNYLDFGGSNLSFLELDEIVFSLTEFLRNKGYLLAQVLLPAQEVRDGNITLMILPGKLSKILLSNNKVFSDEILYYPFEKGLGEIVEKDFIESTILRLNDISGLNTSAVFKPGDNLGETLLTVQILEEKKIKNFIQFDNFGSESSGTTRAFLGISINNFFGRLDTLSTHLFKTFDYDFGGFENGRINYEIVDPTLKHTFGLDYSENNFITKTELKSFGIDSDTQRGDIYLRSSWIRGLDENFSTTINLSSKKANIYSSLSPFYGGEDKLTVAMLEFDYDSLGNRFDGVHRIKFSISKGFDDFLGSMDNNGDGVSLTKVDGQSNLSSEFLKYNLSYTRLQSLGRDYSIFWHTNIQYSDDWLSTLEKMSLGGPYSVRAYPSQEYIRDSVLFSSIALQTNVSSLVNYFSFDTNTLTDAMSLSLFVDYGFGKSPYDALGNNHKVEISGYGMELKVDFPQPNLNSSVIFARPLSNDKERNDESNQLWFSLSVGF